MKNIDRIFIKIIFWCSSNHGIDKPDRTHSMKSKNEYVNTDYSEEVVKYKVVIKGIEEFLFLSVGALVGTFLRYRVVSSPIILGALPINVLTVNVIGSFILGIFSVISLTWNLETKYSRLVAIGFCGSLTTMSSFALESANLMDGKEFYAVALNIISNVGLSLGAVLCRQDHCFSCFVTSRKMRNSNIDAENVVPHNKNKKE